MLISTVFGSLMLDLRKCLSTGVILSLGNRLPQLGDRAGEWGTQPVQHLPSNADSGSVLLAGAGNHVSWPPTDQSAGSFLLPSPLRMAISRYDRAKTRGKLWQRDWKCDRKSISRGFKSFGADKAPCPAGVRRSKKVDVSISFSLVYRNFVISTGFKSSVFCAF